MATTPVKEKLITLVTTRVLTPYKAGEVINVTPEDAKKLKTIDHTKNTYGVERNPNIGVRDFDPVNDADLLLRSGTLNLEDHNRLLAKLYPDEPLKVITHKQYETAVSRLLDEIDPERYKDYEPKKGKRDKSRDDDRAIGAFRPSDEESDDGEDDETEVAKADEGGGLRQRRRKQ
jgi:hypothetical protein